MTSQEDKVNKIIKEEIKKELIKTLELREKSKADLEFAEKKLSDLVTAYSCEHVWESDIRGFQIQSDRCTKCGHTYFF